MPARSHTVDSLPPLYSAVEPQPALPPAYESRPPSLAESRVPTRLSHAHRARRPMSMAGSQDIEMQVAPQRRPSAVPRPAPDVSRPPPAHTCRPSRSYALPSVPSYESPQRYFSADVLPSYTPKLTRPLKSSRTCRNWVVTLLALTAIAGVSVGVAKHFTGLNADSDGNDSGASDASPTTMPSATVSGGASSTRGTSATPTPVFPGLLPGRYSIGGVSIFDNCTALDVGLDCVFSLEDLEYSVSKSGNSYQVEDVSSGNVAMSVTPQTDPHYLNFSRPTRTTQTTNGCSVTQSVNYEWYSQVGPGGFEGKTFFVQAHTDKSACADARPNAELSCLCEWVGSSAAA